MIPPEPRLPVFVYGTLRPGEKNYRRYLAGRTCEELPATIRGRLCYVAEGGYPYLEDGDGRVRGELIFLDGDRYAETLQGLDELEEYDPQDEAGSVYLRRQAIVEPQDMAATVAWVYYWNTPRIRGAPIVSGDFRDRPG
jgi:gamma-glutamylcyclotransferase (GGCT)/AIG2-like uncharacterized protein YtfP